MTTTGERRSEFILRIELPVDEADKLEGFLRKLAIDKRGKLSRIEREQHKTYALHIGRKKLV